MELDQLVWAISSIDSQVEELLSRRRSLDMERRGILAKRWIEANNVRLSDVQLSNGEGVPYFYTVGKFAEWLRGSTMRFAEWNGCIYFTADLVAGRFPEAPATVSDLERLEVN